MVLLDVATRAFRNLEDRRIALDAQTTVVYGPNGQGKTNFLEACYLLCTLRPLRAQRLAELVRLGFAGQAAVSGRFELRGGIREVEVEVGPKGRAARVDANTVRDPEELFGGIATVAFTPDDLAVVKEAPEARRRFLDRAVLNRHPAHLRDSRDYLRALRSRNRLLRQRAEGPLLESFDAPLIRLGARLRHRREELLAEILPLAQRAFAEVARGEAPLAVTSTARDSSEEALAQGLATRLQRDRDRGYTSAGPHADDLVISIGDKPARAYASQGQSRAAVLALKIGEIENLRRAQGRAPLLLLDDVSSELDPERNAYLMRYLAALKGQVVLTTTDPKLVSSGAFFLRVERGRIAPENLVFSE